MPRASSTRPIVAPAHGELVVEHPYRLPTGGVEPLLLAGVPKVELVEEVLDGPVVVVDPGSLVGVDCLGVRFGFGTPLLV
jgi:hypothetical protein